MIQLCRSDAIVKLFRAEDSMSYTLVVGRLRGKPTTFEGLDADGALEALAVALNSGMAPATPELDGGTA